MKIKIIDYIKSTVSIKGLHLLWVLMFCSSVGAGSPDVSNSVANRNVSDCQLMSSEQLSRLLTSKIHFYEFDNGMKVYIYKNSRLPVFALRLLFDVGAAEEEPGQSGYAHLFEHLMFKGSRNVPDGGHFAAIKRVGGNLNAATDYDRTDYWTEAPVQHLDRVLWLEAERLNNLDITEVSLENQLAAVLEEKLLRIDNVPYFKAASEFMISTWQGTDYDHLIIGSEMDLKKASVTAVKDFYERYYQPDNLIMALVGDVEPQQVIKQIEYFFKSSANERLIALSTPIVIKNSNKTISLHGKSAQRYDPLAPFPLYALGWHTIGKQHKDIYGVELLSDILLNHDASRFKIELIQKQELIFDTIGFPLNFEQAGITAMGMVPHAYADFTEIKKVIHKISQDIQKNGISDTELCSAKKYRQLQIIQKLDDNRAMAEMISDGVLFFATPYHFIDKLDAYAGVSNRDIKRIARTYFHDDWLELEITTGPAVKLAKWLLEILPRSFGRSLEQQFL